MSTNIQDWLRKLHESNGSDLFVTVGAPPCIKVHGKMKPLTREALGHEAVMDIINGIMTTDQREEFHTTKECQFAVSLEGVARFRVSAFYQRNSVGMVCRRIETRIPSFEELDLPEALADLSMTKRGIIVLVGATGTGKSTTLAAMVGHRNCNASGHIISIEDPIEFVHKHRKSLVTQREVGIDTTSFDVALKNTLRQAPDVILIGEVRTRESMEHAITFAETGHLCLTTLHANNANQAMDRILHFFPEDRHSQVLLDLSFNLRAVIAQQLIPSVDGNRRHVALEILINTPLVQEKIRKGKIEEIKGIMKDSTHHGMVTFDQSLLRLYQDGAISYEEALRHADSANDVRLAVKLSEGADTETLSGKLQDLNLVDDR
ncbi:PilT/PilU family type 4a pilus ATPase [Wenzhouxiangella marina]|uniref:Twitching motility protein PilT n=1 Tax=Wenzhouxiangella marina TaxID=1579979 RepID=A0A0K0XZF1_9GAMM|nr:PilT/PilU family type 4a pilus ATPase [Wenzhouxiangella marina]AKS43068.1 twitching motility protein PilT [Wenzhouxiangella marina]MBB6087248.1 twitching motility protein PilU [Wenzhouxiangella marina]